VGLSTERQQYHLTPRGWITGTFHPDMGRPTEVPTPEDRVLTLECVDKQSSIYAKPTAHDFVAWASTDKAAIEELQKQFGEKPDWFGYARDNYHRLQQ